MKKWVGESQVGQRVHRGCNRKCTGRSLIPRRATGKKVMMDERELEKLERWRKDIRLCFSLSFI